MGFARHRLVGGRALILACFLALVVVGALGKFQVGNWWTRAAVAAVTAIATLSLDILRERVGTAVKQRAEFTKSLEEGVFMPGRELPLVKKIDDPSVIGVRPAGHEDEQLPPYVKREIDADLRRVLKTSGFVLLVGAATAGKTRTAYEAMRDVLPGHLLIVPTARENIKAAVQQAREVRNCVLWLDDLDDFIAGDNGLTRKDIAEILDGTDHHRVVLATLRAAKESELTTGALDDGEQPARVATAVLDQSHHRIVVKLLFNTDELARAERLASQDDRLREAIRYADRYGIGEYLSGGPQLYDEWENAWAHDQGNHPRGAALIAAAVDCRRVGFGGLLPRALLVELHTGYLARRGGARLFPEPLDEAWSWVLNRRSIGSAPLWQVESGGCDVFDYLVERFDRESGEPVAESIIRGMLIHAGPEDAHGIAAVARRAARFQLAGDAMSRACEMSAMDAHADNLVTLGYRNDLGIALHDQGRKADAEVEFRAVLDARTALLGASHPDTLVSQGNLVLVRHAQGKISDADAGAEYQKIRDTLSRTFGDDHPLVVANRHRLAIVLYGQHRYEEAESEFRAIVAARTEMLGAEHPATLISRNNWAIALEELGLLDRAEAEHRAVLDIRSRVLGADHQHTAISRDNLSQLVRKRSVG